MLLKIYHGRAKYFLAKPHKTYQKRNRALCPAISTRKKQCQISSARSQVIHKPKVLGHHDEGQSVVVVIPASSLVQNTSQNNPNGCARPGSQWFGQKSWASVMPERCFPPQFQVHWHHLCSPPVPSNQHGWWVGCWKFQASLLPCVCPPQSTC